MVFWRDVATALDTCIPPGRAACWTCCAARQPPPLETILTTLRQRRATHQPDATGRPPRDFSTTIMIITGRAIHELVLTLIEHLPPHLRLVLTSRPIPPLRLAACVRAARCSNCAPATWPLTPLRRARFCWTPWASRCPTRSRRHPGRAHRGLAGGASTGRAVVTQPSRRRAFSPSLAAAIAWCWPICSTKLLSGLPPAWQEFLLATAVLDQMCAELCAAVLDQPTPAAGQAGAAAQALLEEMETANLFIIPLDSTSHWYRYHQLFAEALRHRLHQQAPAAERTYRRRAGAWYARAGYGHDAIAQALAAHDWPAAGDWIAQFAEDVRRRGELNTLARWLGALPAGPGARRAAPGLAPGLALPL